MPATRVPGVRDLRCDAKGGDSFQRSAYRVSCRVRAGGSEGLPYGRSAREWADSPQGLGWVPGSGRRGGGDGLGGGRTARRGSPVGVERPARTVANSCGACEG
ncbi:hypothetical protein GCM10015536_19330 [Streptomyces griseomycini]|nr:hypothetical protein GCM10015536_19330 [Streptomyces griseomycini]